MKSDACMLAFNEVILSFASFCYNEKVVKIQFLAEIGVYQKWTMVEFFVCF